MAKPIDTKSPVSILSEKDVYKLICSYGWNCKTALAIARAESGLNCKAIHLNRNNTEDFGLMQINSIHAAKYQGRDIFDPQVNLDVAFQIYKASGWHAWATFNDKSYLKH